MEQQQKRDVSDMQHLLFTYAWTQEARVLTRLQQHEVEAKHYKNHHLPKKKCDTYLQKCESGSSFGLARGARCENVDRSVHMRETLSLIMNLNVAPQFSWLCSRVYELYWRLELTPAPTNGRIRVVYAYSLYKNVLKWLISSSTFLCISAHSARRATFTTETKTAIYL